MTERISPSIVSAALSEEWRMAAERLPSNCRQAMKMPLFSVLPELPGRWGQWRGGRIQCIELKEELLLRHPWYAVVDVLRHEMAHQAVETFFPGLDEAPHGPHFLEFCRILGARPQASGDYPLLDELIYSDSETDVSQEGAVTPQSRLLLKIRKLLSLSESANENEARSALLKARELEAKFVQEYGEAAMVTSDAPDFYTINVGPLLKRATMKYSLLGSILQEFFGVRVIWVYIPDLESGRPSYLHQLCLSGSRKDLRIATYVYDCLTAYISRALYKLPGALLGKALTQAKVRQDFEVGVLTGFQAALREQNQRPEMRALVQSDQSRLDEYYRWHFPTVRKKNHQCTLHSPEARSAGEAAGREFHLKQGLESSNKKTRLLKK